jgi:hypothetical protein
LRSLRCISEVIIAIFSSVAYGHNNHEITML